MQQVTLVVP